MGCCSGKPLLGEVEILISDVGPQYLDDIRAGRWGAKPSRKGGMLCTLLVAMLQGPRSEQSRGFVYRTLPGCLQCVAEAGGL